MKRIRSGERVGLVFIYRVVAVLLHFILISVFFYSMAEIFDISQKIRLESEVPYCFGHSVYTLMELPC